MPYKTRHLDAAVRIFKGPPKTKAKGDLRPQYEASLRVLGWTMVDETTSSSEWRKGDKRMLVENGDRVSMKMSSLAVEWQMLPVRGRKKLLLPSQGKTG